MTRVQCAVCGANIFFGVTAGGEVIALDWEPDELGTYAVFGDLYIVPLARIDGKRPSELYMPHRATCRGRNHDSSAGA